MTGHVVAGQALTFGSMGSLRRLELQQRSFFQAACIPIMLGGGGVIDLAWGSTCFIFGALFRYKTPVTD
jgi:hypothetical protein